MREIPKVYANRVDKKFSNNEKVAVTKSDETVSQEINGMKDDSIGNIKKNINQKIRDIFSSTRYVYKADVEITMKDKKITKKIIGKNGNHLITIDNELIPISDILDINFIN